MAYHQYQPHPDLSPYIDAYWMQTGTYKEERTVKILPDGCIDIILNAGAECLTENGSVIMKNEAVYLVGTMTRFKEAILRAETKLIGIRFKPGAFAHFYHYDSLHSVTDKTIEFEKALSPNFGETIRHTTMYLDHFFLRRLTTPKQSLQPVIAMIQRYAGQINVRSLALDQSVTPRQLERIFMRDMGISPKQYVNFVRYQFALSKIRQNPAEKSLLDIAFECGYYDHSHLTNAIKRYTGVPPSLL